MNKSCFMFVSFLFAWKTRWNDKYIYISIICINFASRSFPWKQQRSNFHSVGSFKLFHSTRTLESHHCWWSNIIFLNVKPKSLQNCFNVQSHFNQGLSESKMRCRSLFLVTLLFIFTGQVQKSNVILRK